MFSAINIQLLLGKQGYAVIKTGFEYKRLMLLLLNKASFFSDIETNELSEAISDESKLLPMLAGINKKDTSNRDSRAVDKEIVMQHEKEILSLLTKASLIGEKLINSDLYYRWVTPNDPGSQSIVHKDIWFHKITDGWQTIDELRNVKIWTPLFTISDYAMGVIPGSHNHKIKDVEYIQASDGTAAFKSLLSCTREDLVPIKVPPGYSLVFPSTLLHGGLDIRVYSPRLSCEVTLQLA